jgi:hypothetical protein
MIQKTTIRIVSFFLIGILVLCVPAAAGTAVIYGSASGFLPERHSDISVVYTLPGQSGGLFDQTVSDFTDPSIDVIFIGNDAEFGSETAAAIEQAVWDGKVLVIGYPATDRFSDSLPLASSSTAEGSKSLVVTSLNNGIARDVFQNLNKTFTAAEPASLRLTGTAKPGSVSLLKFNNGDPALLYREYGKGYVVEWLLPAPEMYLGTTDADTVNYRIITILVATAQGTTTAATTAATTTVPATTIATSVATTAATTQEPTEPTGTTGIAVIQSDPLGAGVYVDGVYIGNTPLRIEGPAGYHSVKMSLEGYYNFDGSAYIVKGETITVFGSLQEKDIQVSTGRTFTTVTPTETATQAPTQTQAASDTLASPTVIAAGIGIITAGIGAYATIYTHRNKDEPKKKE